jgi:hypothetical protein
VQAPPGRIRGILEWTVIILLNAPARIRTRDLWLWYHIELHAPTSSTQKLKLIRKGGQFTYTPTVLNVIYLLYGGRKYIASHTLLASHFFWINLIVCVATNLLAHFYGNSFISNITFRKISFFTI